MALREGEEYLQSLRDDRVVYPGARRVAAIRGFDVEACVTDVLATLDNA